MQSVMQKMAKYPSAWLLLVQLLSLIIHRMLSTVHFHQAIFSCFNVAALALAVWVVNRSPAFNWVAWMLAVPAVVLTIIYVVTANMQYLLWAQCLETTVYFYTAVGLVMYMFNDNVLARDELFVAANTFTVLAVSMTAATHKD